MRAFPYGASSSTNEDSMESVLMESSKHSFMQIDVDRLIRHVERVQVDVIRVKFKFDFLLPVARDYVKDQYGPRNVSNRSISAFIEPLKRVINSAL